MAKKIINRIVKAQDMTADEIKHVETKGCSKWKVLKLKCEDENCAHGAYYFFTRFKIPKSRIVFSECDCGSNLILDNADHLPGIWGQIKKTLESSSESERHVPARDIDKTWVDDKEQVISPDWKKKKHLHQYSSPDVDRIAGAEVNKLLKELNIKKAK